MITYGHRDSAFVKRKSIFRVKLLPDLIYVSLYDNLNKFYTNRSIEFYMLSVYPVHVTSWPQVKIYVGLIICEFTINEVLLVEPL